MKETLKKEPGVLFKNRPSWWATIYAYLLMICFCYVSHFFFKWIPPYLYEVFKNLRGLPTSWADIGLFWAERGLDGIAIGAALYHQFWQAGTRYLLTEQEIRMESWIPARRVVSIPLGAIRSYGYYQNWFGVLLGFGTIEIDTAGLTPVRLPHCPKTKLFLELLKPKVAAALQASNAHRSNNS